MFLFPTTIILRHRKENLKKCSLRGLEARQDMCFYTYPRDVLPTLSNYVLLTIDAPPLTREDADLGLFLIDGTWRHAEVMHRMLPNPRTFRCRSIPSIYQTAYPRRQEDCPEPDKGLASVEALFIAYLLLERDPSRLLDDYHWREDFLNKNKEHHVGIIPYRTKGL
jgi:pre-rRNA-processing protein TSR3